MMKDWHGVNVVIVGAARQGLALAGYLARHDARVVITDLRPAEALMDARSVLDEIPGVLYPVEWVLGDHPIQLLDGTDLLCLSGGVPPTILIAQEARKRGIPLSNDSQIFLEAVPCTVVGITGSAGKSTTTSLIGNIADQEVQLRFERGETSGRIWVGGNIGSPLIAHLDDMDPQDLAVMELSSFQLELMDRSPDVAVILNITPNHLDRHGSMEVYTRIKQRILDFQGNGGTTILGRDDPIAWSLAQKVQCNLLSFGISAMPKGQQGSYVKDDGIYLRLQGLQDELFVMSTGAVRLRGMHNLLNVLAACTIAAAVGLSVEAMRAGVNAFQGMPHRLEYVRTWGGADWYNDSIATAPERTIAAIQSFDEPIILLLGGRDKGLPWDDLAALICERVDNVVIFGEASNLISSAVRGSMNRGERAGLSPGSGSGMSQQPTVQVVDGLEEAVHIAAQIVKPGDIVLLAPGGTSFDAFNDFEERGKCFVQLVRNLT